MAALIIDLLVALAVVLLISIISIIMLYSVLSIVLYCVLYRVYDVLKKEMDLLLMRYDVQTTTQDLFKYSMIDTGT